MFGLLDNKVQLNPGQPGAGSHFSVTETTDHSKTHPKNHSLSLLLPADLENPFRASLAVSKPGITAAVCASRFQGQPRASPLLLTLSAEPYHLAHRPGCWSHCVLLALCYGIRLCLCLTIVPLPMCALETLDNIPVSTILINGNM
ncbi:hypothetical protein WMY93_023810 [Mugilogobius chulae]|uniref:Uncharacterized protein n=1 Tax=Mugilogobius chulae TaxID=88201 RepID=A0AAW0NAZ8_9GOBI